MISLSLRGLLAGGGGGGVLSGWVTDHMAWSSAVVLFFLPPLFLPLKSAALDLGLDMKWLDSFKLLAAQSGSELPDVFNKEPRTVASAASGRGCCSRLLSILSNSPKKENYLLIRVGFFEFNLYFLVFCFIVFQSINAIYCLNTCMAFKHCLNSWTKETGRICSALSRLSRVLCLPDSACVDCRLCARQDFLPETMQQKPHLMWEEGDGLPRESVSGTLSSTCLYYISPSPSFLQQQSLEMKMRCILGVCSRNWSPDLCCESGT